MKIVYYPHPALRTQTAPITTLSKDLRLQAGEMLELMYASEGLGLAAPQVALPVRMIVMNFAGDPNQKESECVAVNPVILESKGMEDGREGCLSFPDLFQKVRRAKTVKAQAYDLDGKLFEMTCSGLAARLWQHEIDHLDGVLYIDKMGMLGRMNSRKYLDDFIAEYAEAQKRGEIPPDLAPKL